jgi:hypothetical protein
VGCVLVRATYSPPRKELGISNLGGNGVRLARGNQLFLIKEGLCHQLDPKIR